MAEMTPKTGHSHYYKDVSALTVVDVYRVLLLYNVTDPCLQHAVKKLLVAGGRGAGKDAARDVQEAMDSLLRWQQMRAEEAVTAVNEFSLHELGPILVKTLEWSPAPLAVDFADGTMRAVLDVGPNKSLCVYATKGVF